MSKAALQPCADSPVAGCCPPALSPTGISNTVQALFGIPVIDIPVAGGPTPFQLTLGNLETNAPTAELLFDAVATGGAQTGPTPAVSGVAVSTFDPAGSSVLDVTIDATGGDVADVFALLVRNPCGCCTAISVQLV